MESSLVNRKYFDKFNNPMLFDGAFGTYYMQLSGSGGDTPCELASVSDFDTVVEIHASYIAAGADAIKTNTFGTNLSLPGITDADILEKHIESALAAANKAVALSKRDVHVYADIGPVQADDDGHAVAQYTQIADIFIQAGAVNFLFETFSQPEHICHAARHIKNLVPDSRIIATFAVRQDGYSAKGYYYNDMLSLMDDCPYVDAAGLNCVCGPSHLYDLARGALLKNKPLCVMPNSGYPTTLGERTVFLNNASHFAQKISDIYLSGASIVGGCCGTTPLHIEKSAKALNSHSGRQNPRQIDPSQKINPTQTGFDINPPQAGTHATNQPQATPPQANIHATSQPQATPLQIIPHPKNMDIKNPVQTNLHTLNPAQAKPAGFLGISSGMYASGVNNLTGIAKKLADGVKIVVVELESPVDADANYILGAARTLRDCGIDAITIADSPLSRTRADSLMMAAYLKSAAGIETIPHLSCRDRNIIAIKAALLGGHVQSLRNLFIITGDPIVATERGSVKGVFNFNSISLIKYIHSLNRTVFCGGEYATGAAINTSAHNFDAELARAKLKQAAGASFFMTQAVFSPADAERVAEAQQKLSVPVLAGIMPLAGYKNALFLNNEVSGINIPQDIVDSFKGKSAEDSTEIALTYCKGLIDRLYKYAGGFYIMSQRRKVASAASVAKYAISKIDKTRG